MPNRDTSEITELRREPLRLFWRIGIGLVVVIAAIAGGSIGAAIVRITCDTNCGIAYAGAVGLGLIFGGLGTLILAVLVARSMQEWKDWKSTQALDGDQQSE